MSSASSCERCSQIALAEADGRMLPASDLAFRHEHEVSCPDCRREARALDLLRMPEGRPAHFPASASERAQTLDAVLAALDAPDFAEDPAPAPAPAEPESAPVVVPFARRLPKPALWVTSLAAAAAALLLVVRGVGPSADQAPAPTARVLLSSGQGLSAGMVAAEGQELVAAAGETSLALGSDIVILLDPGSRARIARLQTSLVEVSLESGRVHASVKPNTPGPRLAVTTPQGRVEVTGTLFSVEARDGASDLRVLRGSVKVSAPGRKVSKVAALQAQRRGADVVRAMDVDEQEVELAAMRRISLLETAEASVLQVRSEPVGARVLLDGEAIGTTPLSAEVKSGHRHLVVATAGRTADEWIDLHSGKVEIRTFDLTPLVAQREAEPDSLPTPALKRPSSKVPAGEMQRRAHVLLQSRDWAGSARAYREFLAAYPSVDLGAWVTYGSILVEHQGDPKGALTACGRYLEREPGGINAAEAFECRIRALRALGRKIDERAAVQEFLDRFPSAVQASEMRRRLEHLR
ncbi:MAG: FecR domain-containing protein [Deltaproteobacteria bacterium]|nr:FecR domain-containing protein [Deltaproteobacteria bacterium]